MLYTSVETSVESKFSEQFRSVKNGRFMNREDETTCSRHENVEGVGEFVIREPGFTEYEVACQTCVDECKAGLNKFFTSLFEDPSTGGDFYCERCKVYHDKYVKTEQGIKDNMHVHKDIEDGSWTDMCTTCYNAAKKADAEYLADELDSDMEPWGFPKD